MIRYTTGSARPPRQCGRPAHQDADDEDPADVRGDVTTPSWNEPAADPDALGLSDDEGAEAEFRAWWPETVTVKPATRQSVQELLDPSRLSWTGCRKAVETASALGARDLFERAALRAVRVAHDGDYKPPLTLRLVARHVLVAKCAEAALTNLAAALADGQARLQAVLDDARRVTSFECWSWG